MPRREMSISAFARRSMLSPKALRLYDESGLLRPGRVDPDSGYRYYEESQLKHARMISLLRRLDVPLATIADILKASPIDATVPLDAWWAHTEDEFERRRELLHYIRANIAGETPRGNQRGISHAVELREVPESTYLFVSSHVTGPDLPQFIDDSHEELLSRAAGYGGAVGAPTVVFRGMVDMDSDGPVDVYLPINPVTTDDDGVRTEVAHTQAFVRLLKRQIEFPQILHVYQAIRTWVDANGHEVSGPPREVYLGAWDSAAASEPICDIAWPIRMYQGDNHE